MRDAATQHVLVEGATARLGGEANQVVDWLDIAPAALPVADAASLASLIRLGQEGWHLQRHATDAWLAVQSPNDGRSAQAKQLLQRAFGPEVTIRLIPLLLSMRCAVRCDSGHGDVICLVQHALHSIKKRRGSCLHR